MKAIIERHQKQIAALCERYGVERLDVFGSAATGRFDESQSDFDFIVQFEDPTKPGIARRYFDLAEDLESVLGHPVDLLTDRPFRNPYFARTVEESRANVYEQGIEEIPVCYSVSANNLVAVQQQLCGLARSGDRPERSMVQTRRASLARGCWSPWCSTTLPLV